MLQRLRSVIKTASGCQYHRVQTSYRTIGRSQPNDAIRSHLNVLTSYKIGKTIQTTDSQTQLPFSQSDEDRNQTIACSKPWFYSKRTTNGSAVCECGSALEGIVQCTNYETQLQVLACYCMTYNEDSDGYVVGLCYYSCFPAGHMAYYSIPSQVNATELNTFQCGDYHRAGQLCGKCKTGFAPSVYSYSLACVECSNYTMNWIKYIAVAFLYTSHSLPRGHRSLQVKCDFWSAQWLCAGNTILFHATTISFSYKFSSCRSCTSGWRYDFVIRLWLLEFGLFPHDLFTILFAS